MTQTSPEAATETLARREAWTALGLSAPLTDHLGQAFHPEPISPGHFTAPTQIAVLRALLLMYQVRPLPVEIKPTFFRETLAGMLAQAPLLILRGETPKLTQTVDVHAAPYGLMAMLTAWSAGQIMTDAERAEHVILLSQLRGESTRSHERLRTWQIGLMLSAPETQWEALKAEFSELSTWLTELCRLAWCTLQFAHEEGDPQARQAAGRLSALLRDSSAQIRHWNDLRAECEDTQLRAALAVAERQAWSDTPGLHSVWTTPDRSTYGHVKAEHSGLLMLEVWRGGMDAAQLAAELGLAPEPNLAARAAFGLLTETVVTPAPSRMPRARPHLTPPPIWGPSQPVLAQPWTGVLARSVQLMSQEELTRLVPLPAVMPVPELTVLQTLNTDGAQRIRFRIAPHAGDLTPAILAVIGALQAGGHHTALEQTGELVACCCAAQGHHTLAAAARMLSTKAVSLDTVYQLSILAGWISAQEDVNADSKLDDLMKTQTSARQLSLLKAASGDAPRAALLLAWTLCRDDLNVEQLTGGSSDAHKTVRLLAAREQVSAWSWQAAPGHRVSANVNSGLMAIIKAAARLGSGQAAVDTHAGQA